jgi:hypothetical protein
MVTGQGWHTARRPGWGKDGSTQDLRRSSTVPWLISRVAEGKLADQARRIVPTAPPAQWRPRASDVIAGIDVPHMARHANYRIAFDMYVGIIAGPRDCPAVISSVELVSALIRAAMVG